MKLELEQQHTYGKTLLYTIYRTSFLHDCHIEESTVEVNVSLSAFISVNENMKQTFK
jgi:hypothetical protein